MTEERYHATTQNRFYPDMSNVNRNITVGENLISPPTYWRKYCLNDEVFSVVMNIIRFCNVVMEKNGGDQ